MINEVLHNLRVVADNASPDGVRVDAAVLRRWADEAQRLHDLLRLVQSDAGNWLHSDLQSKIEEAVGAPGPYRALDDAGTQDLSPP